MEIVQNIALISINETLIVQLILFLLFLFIINRLMIRPLSKVMKNRDEYIETIKNNISESKEEIDNILNKIKEDKSIQRKIELDIQKDIKDQGNKETKKQFDITQNKIRNLRKKAKIEIDILINEARKSIQGEGENISNIVVEKILNRS